MDLNQSSLIIKNDYGHLVSRVIPTPSDRNSGGSIFGGWILTQIDIAASLAAIDYCKGRVSTKSVNNVDFKKPIFHNSLVDIYAKIKKTGKTSMYFDINVFSTTNKGDNYLAVTAEMVFVKINDQRKPTRL